MCAPVVHPDVMLLQRQCADMRGRIRAVVDEWHALSTVERPRLTALYDRYFGSIEREYQRLALDAAELFRRVELLSIKVARGERLTADMIDHVNRVVDKEYARFHQRLHQAFDMNSEQRNDAAVAGLDSVDDDELMKTYRILVKRLHPDAVGRDDTTDPMWQQVQEAYAARSTSTLRSLLSMLDADVSADASTQGWSIERLQREVGLLTSRLDMERRKLERLRASEPISIARDLEDPSWRSNHEHQLRSRLAAKQREYDETRKRYVEITGNTALPGRNPNRTAAEQQEAQDFMENTYFGAR
ncbi:MAG: J domain-containing protein [Candidatus Kapabacteria bacterium]|nr:J domain-containing protein [Candidatus Kapabacteria bacterium]